MRGGLATAMSITTHEHRHEAATDAAERTSVESTLPYLHAVHASVLSKTTSLPSDPLETAIPESLGPVETGITCSDP